MPFNPPNYYNDTFFMANVCERCGEPLDARTMSWFNTETICMKCARKEDKLKQKMRERGMNPDDYEG